MCIQIKFYVKIYVLNKIIINRGTFLTLELKQKKLKIFKKGTNFESSHLKPPTGLNRRT
jgi:hypothetical protein